MTRIAPVNLAFNPKTLWFDACDLEIAADDRVVVTTARGVELGTMAGPVFEATEEDMSQLKSALKAVKRVATEEDIARASELEEKSREAMVTFREVAAKHNESMHPVSVEFLLEGDKAVFYFEAEERLDFRDIVRELASDFGVRVDMRQVGVRDEARMVGGIGHCGQELCCKRLGGEFCPVSIRMAKEQGLSLNPQKISGVCGRLMCCLRYEYEAYKEFHSRAPKQNSTVQTPAGPAKVSNLDVPREIVDLKIEIDGKMKTVHVPLADMEPPEEGARPKAIGEEAWDRAVNPPLTETASALFLTSQFTGNDTLGETRAVRRNNANVKNATGSTSMVDLPKAGSDSRRRRRRGSGKGDAAAAPLTEVKRVRRRRSTTVSADGTTTVRTDVPGDGQVGGASSGASVRPGHKSSSLAQAREQVAEGQEGESSHNRRRRHRGGAGRRRHNTEGKGGDAAATKDGQATGGTSKPSRSSEGGAADVAGGNQEGGRRRRRRSRKPKTDQGEGTTHEA